MNAKLVVVDGLLGRHTDSAVVQAADGRSQGQRFSGAGDRDAGLQVDGIAVGGDRVGDYDVDPGKPLGFEKVVRT